MSRRRPPVPALVVPDTGAWALWGRDLRALGFAAVSAPEQASVLLAPERVPAGLVDAVAAAWDLLPLPRRHVALGDPLAVGEPLEAVLGRAARGNAEIRHGRMDHGDTDHDNMDHDNMDHGDMMAITGNPSADGLVMEDADVELGPLLSPLPGGLRARIALDGDVVASCTIEALLHAPADSMTPDPRAERAWSAAFAAARDEGSGWGRRLAAVEIERALSHLIWIGGLGELLGWAELSDRARVGVAALIRCHCQAEASTREAQQAVDRVESLLDGSRRLRSRAGGIAVVTTEEAARRRLAGPNARASNQGDEGDAQARVLVRATEAAHALRLADHLHTGDPPAPTEVEGPRGPVLVEPAAGGRPLAVTASGAAAAITAAAEHAVGLEWSRALVALYSFDLSPWQVGE